MSISACVLCAHVEIVNQQLTNMVCITDEMYKTVRIQQHFS